ncbi:lytic transglycosylase domain-containing protein [Clostridium bornimense]|uniref:lytic transglycosylase domain-containing protein n=1 Tax=Clostridium bornimense TaxID=1216932 RepID=UPI0020A14F3E|nr:lytic transglycosylase domain-containing protein [Clostridium bornimense]
MDISSILNSYSTELQKTQLDKLSNLSSSNSSEETTESAFKMQLMLSMIQQMFKDSDAYSIVMQSFASAMKSSNFSFDGLFNTNTTTSSYSNVGSSSLTSSSNSETSNSIYDGVDEKVATAIDKACKKYNMDPSFIMAVIKQESNFNSNAVSSAGATGIMQIMPFNFAGLGITDPYDVEQNIDGGTKMLSNLLDVYQDKKMALAAYNAGSGTLANRNITGEQDFDRLPSETQDYVKKVSAYEEMYNKYV